MGDSVPERTCPVCGKSEIKTDRASVAYYSVRLPDSGDVLITQWFHCRRCGHEFTEVEEHTSRDPPRAVAAGAVKPGKPIKSRRGIQRTVGM